MRATDTSVWRNTNVEALPASFQNSGDHRRAVAGPEPSG